jgi:hypothetical protein
MTVSVAEGIWEDGFFPWIREDALVRITTGAIELLPGLPMRSFGNLSFDHFSSLSLGFFTFTWFLSPFQAFECWGIKIGSNNPGGSCDKRK